MITLMPDERRKFIEYLEQQAASDESIAEQLGTLPGTQPMARRSKMRARTKLAVAEELRVIEELTVGGQS